MQDNTMNSKNRNAFTWLGLFAHPDDETSASAGTMVKWVRDGNHAYVVSATGGELGTLGTGELVIERSDLAQVRESELKQNLSMYGCNPPFLLGYRDQELAKESLDALSIKVLDIMYLVHPDVIVTFGPTGISNHSDHIAIHKASRKAYIYYKNNFSGTEYPLLIYPSIPDDVAKQYSLELSPDEKRMDIIIDIESSVDKKIQGLKNYKSQKDAQEFAKRLHQTRKVPHGNKESFSVSPDSPQNWDSYVITEYLRSL